MSEKAVPQVLAGLPNALPLGYAHAADLVIAADKPKNVDSPPLPDHCIVFFMPKPDNWDSLEEQTRAQLKRGQFSILVMNQFIH